MANNESDNKKGMNTIDSIDESHILTELERIGAKTGRKTSQRAMLEQRISSSGKALNSLLEAGQDIPEIRSSPLYQQQVPQLQHQIRGIRARMNSMNVGSVAAAESEASTFLSRQFDPGSINTQARNMQPLTSIQNRAANMSGMGYDDLYAKRESVLSQINSRERVALREVPGMFGPNGRVDPEKSATLGAEFSGVKDLVQELAAVNVAMKKLGESAEKAGEKLGGGGGVSGVDRLNAYSGMFAAGGSAIREIAVNQRVGQVQNISGYAGFENQKYDMYKGARGGDVMSQLLLSQAQESERFGNQLYAGQQAANTAFVAGGAAQTAAGAGQAFEGGIGKFNPISQFLGTAGTSTNETLQGSQNMVQGAAGTAIAGTDLARGVSASAAKIQGQQADLEARRALLGISAQQLQGFRDFGVGQGTAAMGMGRRGEGFLQRTVTNENMDKMVNARISPEQFNQMSQIGVDQVGSTFNESQIFAARGLERSGLGSMQQNMGRMATLAGAGANNPQAGLGSVMEAAFSKSLDGSKVLNSMVENTAAIVQQSAGTAMGLDTTRSAAQILAGGVAPNAPNQEFAVNRAMSVQDKLRSIGTDTGVNFAAMSATARISKNVGVSGDEALILQGFDDATLKSLQNATPNEARAKLKDRGVGSLAKKSDMELKDAMSKLVTERMITTFTGGSVGLAEGVSGGGLRQLVGDVRGGKLSVEDLANQRNLSPEQAKIAERMSRTAGLQNMGLSEMIRGATGITSTADPKSGAQVKGAMEGTSPIGDMRKTIDDMRTSGFAQLSEAAKEATKNFKNASEAVKGLGLLVKQLEQPGMEEKFGGAAAKSAGTFGADTVKFQNSVGTFSVAVDKLMKMVDIDHRRDINPAHLIKSPMTGDHKQGPK